MNNLQNKIIEPNADRIAKAQTVADYKNLLKRHPDDAALLKAFADFINKKKRPDEAAVYYGRAASLFLKSGNLLPAIASIVYRWRIKSPSYEEAKLFLSAIRDESFPSTAIKIFLKNLSNPEVMAVVKNFEIIYLPEHKLLHKVDDTIENLYFIVFGSLKEVCYRPVETEDEIVYKQIIVELSADGAIGDLYPLSKKRTWQSYVETLAPVEMIKISKTSLQRICNKYPNVESGLQAINVFRAESQREDQMKKQRKGSRHQLQRKVAIEIHPQSAENFPIILEGYSTDISVGGTSILLDSKDVHVAKSVASFSKTIKNSKVKISFPTGGLELKVSGRIAWTKEVILPKEKTLAVGIQFRNLTPKLRGMLFVFAESSNI